MNTNYTIRREHADEYRTVENLTREAFWNVYRPGCDEHYIVHIFRSREDFIPELDLVMEKDGEIIGHVMYVRAEIHSDDGRNIPIVTFGPISISPVYQRQGYGTALVRCSTEKALDMGFGAAAITGNINFYGKFGFVAAKNKGIRYSEDPEANYFLIKELIPGFLDDVSGTYKDSDGYFVDAEKAEEFDRQFPPKIKLKLPGQLV